MMSSIARGLTPRLPEPSKATRGPGEAPKAFAAKIVKTRVTMKALLARLIATKTEMLDDNDTASCCRESKRNRVK